MAEEHLEQLKAFITLTEGYLQESGMEARPVVEAAAATDEVPDRATLILEELARLIFKLRTYTELNESADAGGIEAGMAKASDMIENVIRRFTNDEGDEIG